MLRTDNTALVLIDVQGKLARIMHESDQLISNITALIKGLTLLDVPIIWLEQYPKGLGPTHEEIQKLLENNAPIDKVIFSACGSEQFQEVKQKLTEKNFAVAGIEAHICVYQTVKELLAEGNHVEVLHDCISSRTLDNKQVAIDKMSQLGALATSVEMLLFELMQTAEHPNFKEISKLIK